MDFGDKCSNKRCFIKRYAFDKFYDNMLLVWITGIEAEYAESLSLEEIQSTLTQLLRQILDKKSIPEPNKIIMYEKIYF